MSEFKGTPGPWTGKDVGVCKQDDAGLQIGFIMTFDDNRTKECAANAQLIVAAPELLDALQSMLYLCDDTRLYPKIARMKIIDKARAAIAKALGETK